MRNTNCFLEQIELDRNREVEFSYEGCQRGPHAMMIRRREQYWKH